MIDSTVLFSNTIHVSKSNKRRYLQKIKKQIDLYILIDIYLQIKIKILNKNISIRK